LRFLFKIYLQNNTSIVDTNYHKIALFLNIYFFLKQEKKEEESQHLSFCPTSFFFKF